jgi:hypothetical protein
MPDNLFYIDPELNFPVGQVFEVPDHYNGHQRGTWYYRSHFSETLRGPFMSSDAAQFHLIRDDDGA